MTPDIENVNATARMDKLDHAANVGRERGRKSPRSVSPARVARSGRIGISGTLCTPTKCEPTPTANPQIAY